MVPCVTGSGTDAITDYVFIGISNNKPVVYINYGTGHVVLSINRNVNDGRWHKLELSSVDRVRFVSRYIHMSVDIISYI